jgi:Sensors of blue-light using FAD
MTASSLHRLVYYSRNRILGTPAELATEVEAILASAQRNNSSINVTGALIFNAGIFAQVLEGARHNVELTFERIQRDQRHSDAQVLAFEEVPNRGFPSWSMAFVGGSREGQNLFGHIGEMTAFEAKRMEGERIFEIMCAIAIEEEVCAA